jgi:hypothetical protein
MAKAALVVLLCGVGMAGVGNARAQQQPAAYTVTLVNSMFGPAVEETVYRDGSRAVIDLNTPAQAGGAATHVRSLYDLNAHTNQSWDLTDSSGGCSSGTFSGDWGDPFESQGELSTAKMTGTETMNGFSTKVYEVEASGLKAKAWVDAKTGMTVKMQMAQSGAEPKTMVEVKKLTVGAPAASVFVVPASCTAAAGPPPVSQRDQDIAVETGGQVGDFVDAVMTTAPGSQDTCSVAIRVMKAGSMTPIASGFKLSANVIDDAKWAQGDTSPGANVPVTAGANGVWKIARPPPHFNLMEDFGNAGGGGGMIHRQCWGPVSTLLLVVKDPANLGKGADWVWDKNGKYAVK